MFLTEMQNVDVYNDKNIFYRLYQSWEYSIEVK